MKIWLVIAEHFNVPGLVRKAFATRELAEAEAISLVDIMWHDSGKKTKTTAGNWKARLATLQTEHGSGFCYVDLVELPVEGAQP